MNFLTNNGVASMILRECYGLKVHMMSNRLLRLLGKSGQDSFSYGTARDVGRV